MFGIVPALQLSKPDLYHALKEAGRTVGEGGGRQRLRGLFVVSQVALSLILLDGTGLLLNSFYRVLRVSPGFAPENLLTMEYRLPRNKYQKPEQQWAFHREVVERIRSSGTDVVINRVGRVPNKDDDVSFQRLSASHRTSQSLGGSRAHRASKPL